jgi:hypothetical protein
VSTPDRQQAEAESQHSEFEKLGDEAPLSLPREFLLFLREHKKWWLVPILLAMAVLGLLAMLTSTGAAPFIYTMF